MIVAEKPPLNEDLLMHYGIKGMKWGTRKSELPGVSSRTSREARKDAQEFARAKLFYGEGAGTRRKLIKAKVEQKSKQDPNYKQAFDHHLTRQDFGKHAERARGERRRKDAKSGIGKNVRAIHRTINGPFAGPVAATAILGAVGYLKSTGLDQRAIKIGRDFVNQRKFGAKVDLSFLRT